MPASIVTPSAIGYGNRNRLYKLGLMSFPCDRGPWARGNKHKRH